MPAASELLRSALAFALVFTGIAWFTHPRMTRQLWVQVVVLVLAATLTTGLVRWIWP